MTTFTHVPRGRSDLRVIPICLGTKTFGEQVDEPTPHDLPDHALARGISLIAWGTALSRCLLAKIDAIRCKHRDPAQ